MPVILFIIFISVPLIEIAIFLIIGEQLGILTTIALVIITAVIGTSLLQFQGLSVFQNAQKSLSQGQIPVDSVIDGVCLLVAGVLLLTPGFLTDSIGFILFVPPLRRKLARWIFGRLINSGKLNVEIFEQETNCSSESSPKDYDPTIIDAEYETVNPKETKHSNKTRPPNTGQKNDGSPWKN